MAESIQKRISQLDPAVDETQSLDIVTQIISSQTEAAKWSLPIDYVKPEDDPNPDRGTKRVPLTRVALLTKSGLVPASMLPSYISTVKRGQMTVSNGKWTFTEVDTGNKYVCPNDPGAGEETPSIDCIYADIGTTSSSASTDDYYQYRFVPTGITGEDNTGNFVPIPSDLVVKDGEGTVVTDDLSNYTRQIDVNIGSPANPGQDGNPLLISSGELCHAKFHGTTVNYPSSQPTGYDQPAFGGTFNVPSLTINATGHAVPQNGSNYVTITVPSTKADSSTAGLVKIGTTTTSIGSPASAGTTTSSTYIEVAAADHVHDASTLTLNNINESNRSQLIYNGSEPVSYDFVNILHAKLPTGAPSDGYILSARLENNEMVTRWVSPDSAITPVYLFAPVSTGGVTQVTDTIAIGIPTEGNVLAVSSNAITGIRAGKTYMVSYNISLQSQAPGANLVDFTIGAKIGSGTASVNKHVVDESIFGNSVASLFPQWVSGTIFVNAGQSGGNLTLECSIVSGISWMYTGGTIQVAEVK